MKEAKITPENAKFLEGMRLAVRRLIEQARRNDEEIVISRNGQPVRVKAREL
ncbi:hypothetical protein [Larkinella soli]|uniref:hypothetical protein n=1 Tax=Larkinella soli TaxID=1770527 RepID=UPI0013E2A31D|nr:hypothetical protein [Larkinella soli]